jgi:hypothetical protein
LMVQGFEFRASFGTLPPEPDIFLFRGAIFH